MTTAAVMMWGTRIGGVTWDTSHDVGVFEYDPDFIGYGIEPSPFTMPLRLDPYLFAGRNEDTFHGLPGMLADSLPDRFGQRMIEYWLAENNMDADGFNPVDRLLYIGSRGMGALEFRPELRAGREGSPVAIDRMTELVNRIMNERGSLHGHLLGNERDRNAMAAILESSASAGGARAKAVLAWNPKSGEFRSGQVDAGSGFEPWLLKFDGIEGNRGHDRELADPQGFGRIEYGYHLMAREAGIEMNECRLHHENGRGHFMTRRFDRDGGDRIHMQTLGALRHFAIDDSASHSQEQVIETIRGLGMGMDAVLEQYRRAVFNIFTRNQDDHVKNVSFLMDREGNWKLSPAYDLTFAFNPKGWTRRHQMSVTGRNDGFERGHLFEFADRIGIRRRKARDVLDRIFESVQRWPEHAAAAEVPATTVEAIGGMFRWKLMVAESSPGTRPRRDREG